MSLLMIETPVSRPPPDITITLKPGIRVSCSCVKYTHFGVYSSSLKYSTAPHHLHPHWLTVPGFRRRSNEHLPNLAIAHLLRYVSRCAACFVFEVGACACRKQLHHDIGVAADGCKMKCCKLTRIVTSVVNVCSTFKEQFERGDIASG